MERRGDATDVPPVAGREEGQQPDRGMLRGVRGAGKVGLLEPGVAEHTRWHRPPDRRGVQGADRQVEGLLRHHLTRGDSSLQVGDDLVRDVELTEGERAPTPGLVQPDRKSTRLQPSHYSASRMQSYD